MNTVVPLNLAHRWGFVARYTGTQADFCQKAFKMLKQCLILIHFYIIVIKIWKDSAVFRFLHINVQSFTALPLKSDPPAR